ncbi:MAG TPA: ice-binding family protein [Candidatus Saccharimonadales bacterium]|nr:ice-binding family protein [Candidatus Saccharimonadales bacterium]
MKEFNTRPLVKIILAVVFVMSLTVLAVAQHAAYAAQPTVDLQTAAPFAILAGTGITDTGNTSVITGDVGVSPATGADIGLFCPQVTGTIYGVNAAYVGDGIHTSCYTDNGPLLVTAQDDLTTAYNDAAGRTPVTTVPTELGGTTLDAGVYNSDSTTFQITAGAGPLVLDGQDNPNAIFIFQMNADGTGLTVGPGSTVSLINDASPCNVFWELNTAAINTTAVFKGNILALNSITVANGANIEGRLLAQNGDVTLINDTITNAACTVSTSSGSGRGGGSSTTTSAALGTPNTGFGVHTTNPWQALAVSALGAIVLLDLAFLIRKTQKRQ